MPKAVTKAGKATASAGRRAGERVGQAAVDTGAVLAASSKYLAAGALVGAAAGAAFEASQKQPKRSGRKTSGADGSDGEVRGVARRARRAGERVGQAAVDAGAGLAASSKYLAAGALVGAAAGAAFEARQKRPDGTGRNPAGAEDSDEGARGVATRAIGAVSEFAVHVGEVALQKAKSIGIRKEDEVRDQGSEVGSEGESVGTGRERGTAGQGGGFPTESENGSGERNESKPSQVDQPSETEEPDFEIVRGQTVTEDAAEQTGDDESEPTDAGTDGVDSGKRQDSEESCGIVDRPPERRRNKLAPAMGRGWEA